VAVRSPQHAIARYTTIRITTRRDLNRRQKAHLLYQLLLVACIERTFDSEPIVTVRTSQSGSILYLESSVGADVAALVGMETQGVDPPRK